MTSASLSPLQSPQASNAGVLDQRLVLDVQGVDDLRRTVRSSPQEGLKQASKQFEVLFMQMVLKSMREATPSEGLLGSEQEKVYTSMLDQQLAQNLSGRGLGLAEAMFAQLSRNMQPQGQPDPSALSTAPAAARPVTATPPQARVTDLSLYEVATAQATLSRSVLPQAHVEQFVTRLLPAAQRASQASGVPEQLIMAQAALESGWGRREIRADDGQNSFNLFGIKADKQWRGAVVETTTTEYVNGVAQKERASFRAYGSYEEGFLDYAKLIGNNPRYAKVRNANSAADAALGLQQAGYATDPNYGSKLIRIMKQMS
ncbi:MAG: flagellar assembly peptidoglycan hydrolase FlgJ [Rhodoferax sp.]|uniref:flagellar assembly peptidoglycan hydrolase FlgJ n=1 Tax=Rhodoferax sp. TaxID=50421 RepID=UPI0008D01A9B|nr:flagellar assembly peptidoglycan hydrolase FlgJ [Rhodoferax sp.]MDP2680046.1 flagellar assembly peptidoglycan hydrolase FlgJ [Rhodoferax sp.]OGB51616.1 MAG: flagellar rod assembly protein/muramidase FlgJ [Burkholderiales bacterium RIFOXYD12_FULL_59_19]OGB73964.1 MAG: flagellar rod assembly protein/muramidase FlgJ [Burkholderiales bacterium RIFOXYC12_FULL_60_6]OGB82842.1 MAG: flagellar rod assembly protein/muramidase FlgJ [Burkholderiales bacterium RIFOXYD2_FULL_59_8]